MQKALRWDGPNKRRVRSFKLAAIAREQRDGFLPLQPEVLSFPGAQAHLERALVARGITRPHHITAVQTSTRLGGHEGKVVLQKLLRVRNRYLPGMLVWPATFETLTEGWGGEVVQIPAFTRGGAAAPAWFRSRTFRKEMEDFIDTDAVDFHVLDIDVCGGFSRRLGECLSRLMSFQKLANRGLLFVNHQKGRDGRFGALFAFLREYFQQCPYFDPSALHDRETGEVLDLEAEDELGFYFIRYILTPIYYICEAYEGGYHLEVERLVEYRDRNKDSGAGVTMLQWFFRFARRACKRYRRGTLEYQRALGKDQAFLARTLEIVATETYPYARAVD